MFNANLVILAQICNELSHGQAEFSRILSKIAKMTLKVTVNDLRFQYQPQVSQDACLLKIWWFQLKFVTSYRYGWKDGQTDRHMTFNYHVQ